MCFEAHDPEIPEGTINLEAADGESLNLSSFLELEEKSKEKAKAMSMIKSLMMMKLAPKKRRYTEDNRVCSSAFSFNGKAYTDCTTDLSPDGNTGKEWCFVASAGKGEKFWSWCKPTLDWDKIREKNQEELKKVAVKGRMIYEEIEKWIKPGLEIIEQIKIIRNGQAEFDDKIGKLSQAVSGMSDSIKGIFEMKNQWEQDENKIMKITSSIEEYQSKDKESNPSQKAQPTVNPSPEILRLEKEQSGVVVNIFVQTKVNIMTMDCSGLLNYEDDPLGDGLNAYFYDNEIFQGKPFEQKDGPIQYNWTGSSPVPGVNSSNFSVRFHGYLYIPYTSNFKFAVECDDNAKLIIGGRTILKHGFYAESESFNTVEAWLKAETNKRSNKAQNSDKTTSSDSIYLVGGSKVKIVLEYSHSTYNDVFEDEKSFLNLYWESEFLKEMIISKRYLYSDNNPSPVKLSNIDKNTGVIRKLIENDVAFKDTDKYLIMDVPRAYLGLPTLKLDSKYTEKEITFNVSEPSIIYIGVMDHFPNPLKTGWDDTGFYMSLMEIDKQKSSKFPGKIWGERSTVLKIFRKKYRAGTVKIPLDMKSINSKGVSLIVFFGADDEAPLECGGEELWISEPDEKKGHFKSCSDSSHYSDFWSCRQGLVGVFSDKEGTMWASKNEGVNAWLEVEFKGLYQVSRIEYQNRNNPNERNSKITAIFSGEETYEMNFKNNNDKLTFKIEPPILSSSVKFVVNSVYGTINNGGSFKVFGMKCPRKDEVEAAGIPGMKIINTLFTFPDTTIISLACGESLLNASAKFSSVKKSPGNSVTIKCSDNCSTFTGSIYGSEKYTMDSVICKAAYHSKKLAEEGGLVKLLFEPALSSYKDEYVRGIQSERKRTSDYSIAFDQVEDDNAIKLQSGIKVDAKVGLQWQKGIIIDIKETPTGKIIQVTIEDTDGSKPIPYSYPTENLKPCGEMITNRECVGSRKKFINQSMKIRFAPSSYTNTGDSLVDNGEVFGNCGKSFGWNIDMTKNMKQRDGAKQLESETFAEFNYSPTSKKCQEVTPEISCEKATWTMKVGHGKYNVKLYFGQPYLKSTVNFWINDKPVAVNRIADAGTLDMIDYTVDSEDQKITIRGDCITNCKDTRTILNMVEVKPILANDSIDAIGLSENASTCNNALKGGPCTTGKGNILHCLYDNPQSPGASACGGVNIFMKIPDGYRCVDQIGKYKCVKRTYENSQECLRYCPKACQSNNCFYT